MNGTMHVRGYEEAFMQFSAYRVHKHLITYVPPVLVLLGTVGNLLSVLILSQRAMRKHTTYFYLAMLSSADTIVLYVGLLRLWLGEILGKDLRDWNDWSCRIISFLGYTVSDFSGWLIIAVTFERFLAVRYPFRASGFSGGRQRAVKVVCALFATLSLINCHFFWTLCIVYMKYDGNYTPKCHSTGPYLRLIDDIWPWVDAFIYSFLPFVIILALNALIIRQIILAKRRRREMRSVGGRKPSVVTSVAIVDGSRVQDRDGTKLTVMLMVVSFTFLITTLPLNVALITTKMLLKRQLEVSVLINLRLIMTITELLMYVNHSINFFLYCAAGHKFRSELVCLLLRRKSTHSQHLTEISGALSHALQVQLIKTNDVNRPLELMQLQPRVV